jgi:hypothetical protein
MANEITATIRLSCVNGSFDTGTISVSGATYDQAAAGAQAGIQNIGTSDETLTDTNLTNKGWLYMRNLDDTNFVEWGFTNAYGGKMEATETVGPFRTNTAADIHLKADTAACDVQYLWLED